MFRHFRENMMYVISREQNQNGDGSINWNFVDADMYVKWSVLLDAATYDEWFNRVADEVEGVTQDA